MKPTISAHFGAAAPIGLTPGTPAPAQSNEALWEQVRALNVGLTYGYCEVDGTFMPTDTEQLQTVHATLFWDPLERVTVGLEVSWVERELANGRSADATRLQASVQFNF